MEEVAMYFDVSVRTIRNWIRRGLLPQIKLARAVRIPRAAVERLVQGNGGPPVRSDTDA